MPRLALAAGAGALVGAVAVAVFALVVRDPGPATTTTTQAFPDPTGSTAPSSVAEAEVTRALPEQSADPADYFLAPRRLGSGDGSSRANAAPLARLDEIVAGAEPGTVIELLSDQGPYEVSKPISMSNGGTEAASIVIRGPLGSDPPVLRGNRKDPYSPSGEPGPVVFRLAAGADHLVFANLRFENAGNGCFRVVAAISNLTITSMTAGNVRRFFENGTSGEGRDATVNGLTISDVRVDGFSKGVIRLGHETHDVLIADVSGDSRHQDEDNFAIGVHLTDRVHDVRMERVAMSNARDTLHDYWNGDGFATEEGVERVHLIDTEASGNTDAGYDLKSSDTLLERAVAVDNKRNFRLWGTGVLLRDCVARDPELRGGTGAQTQVQVLDRATVVIVGCSFSDDDPSTVVFEIAENSSVAVVDTEVDHRGELSVVEEGSRLELADSESRGG